MKLKFRSLILLPILFSGVGCSRTDVLTFQTGSMTFETYYNDSYFLSDNHEVHEGIALASHAMALATFNGDEDFTVRSRYLRNLWNDMHFSNIWMNEAFYVKPGTDTIAFGVASKKIDDFTLLAVAVRGGNYDGEWSSNLTIGDTGDAKGFDEASDQVVDGINKFIKNYSIKGHVKFWISGYSRAAITSNMTAGKLLNKINDGKYSDERISYTSDDFFAYCFEPPMGVNLSLNQARKDLYHGIHNFLNYNDLVPLVAPYEWGFVRYGQDHYYPDRINDIYFDATEREKIISLYHFTYGAENFANYSVDDWKFFDVGEEKASQYNLPRQSVNTSQGRSLRAFIRELANRGFQSREIYHENMEEGLRHLLATVFGLNEDIDKINGSNLVDIIFEYDFIKTLFLELEEGQSGQFALDVQMLFLQIFGANEKNIDKVKELYSENFTFFFLLPQAFALRKDILAQLLYRDNMLGLLIGHMPELSYTFLRSCTSLVMRDRACKLNDGNYQTLHVSKPSSFSIFEKNLKKTIFTFEDGVIYSDYVAAERYANGNLAIHLPKNGQYEYLGDCVAVGLGQVDPLTGEDPLITPIPNSGEF